MLQVARLSPTLLGDAADLTAYFLSTRLNPDGGFQDRDGASDLYYTVFGLEGLIALQRDLPAEHVRPFLAGHDDPEALDFVHAACLARCWADIGAPDEAPAAALRARLEAHRTLDGGYNQTPGAEHGSAYGCFLAIGAYEDLGAKLPDADGVARCLAGAARGGRRLRELSWRTGRTDAADRRRADAAAAPVASSCAGRGGLAAGAACG